MARGGVDLGEETLDGSRQTQSLDGYEPEGKLVLVVLLESDAVTEFDLGTTGEFTVGRSATADIRINAASVSRDHAMLKSTRDGVTIRDEGSTNGTVVNGGQVGGTPVEIGVGDAILFGDVSAQLRRTRLSRLVHAQLLTPGDFDGRVADEAERCVSYDRSIALIALEATNRDASTMEQIERTITQILRGLDAVTKRSPTRIDILRVETTKEEAVEFAGRIQQALHAIDVNIKIAVATFPRDVPSADSLPLAAQLALHSAADGEVGTAREGARVLQIGPHEVVIAEPSMIRLFGLVERVAGSPMPVLIYGETGTGKEIVAEAIHTMSPRAAKPFIKLNCAAVPENLLESELFGHEKGAFSGATAAKQGLFEAAHGGTLFLDEIGEMAPSLQAKLLRVVEDRHIRRVGATSEKQVDVRLVAATHRDLQADAETGSFRQDLYFRLSVVVLEIPPLRERKREIPLLAERFAAEAVEQLRQQAISVSPETMDALRAYPWPGNIRELRNAMSAAAMVCDGSAIEPAHLPAQIAANQQPRANRKLPERVDTVRLQLGARSLEEDIRELERDRIVQALEACDGNQTKAAQMLGMPRRTFLTKLDALDIDAPRRRRPQKK